jgi:Arc/MetJ-type ribon-helix-helix transcriptional regulator
VTITIRPEHEHLIVEAIENGSYQSPEDLIAHALEVLRSEDEWLDENKTAICAKIERAFGQFERGEFFSAGQSRAEMEKRKAEWLREHRG